MHQNLINERNGRIGLIKFYNLYYFNVTNILQNLNKYKSFNRTIINKVLKVLNLTYESYGKFYIWVLFLVGFKIKLWYSSVKGNLNWLNELLVYIQNPSVNGQLFVGTKGYFNWIETYQKLFPVISQVLDISPQLKDYLSKF